MRGILRAVIQKILPNDALDVDDQLETSLKKSSRTRGKGYMHRKYLIVIDDIGMDQWSIISSTFKDNGTSSRIILTTTIQSIANSCSHGNGYVHQMNTLGEEDCKEIALPTGIRSPDNLQTLAGFITGENEGFLKLMGHMKKLRKVKIWCKHVAGSSNYIADLSQAIQEFTKVPIDSDSNHSLSLDSGECSEDFLSALHLEPCSEDFKYHVRSLKLQGRFLRLTPFVTSLSGLTEVFISSATLTQDHLSALITLNRLLYLKLIADKLENFEIKHGAFPSLRRLCFVVKSVTSDLPTIKQGALPNLVSLHLLCRGLVGLSGIEIRHLKHLKEVVIDSDVTPQTKQDWARAAKNHPNRPKFSWPRKVDLVESEEPAKHLETEKRKYCSNDELDYNLQEMRLSESRDHKRQKIGEGDTSKSSVGLVYPMYGDVGTDRTQVHLSNEETRRYDRTEVDQKCPEMLQECKDKCSMVVDVDLRSDEQVNPPHPKLKNLMPGKEYDRQELIPTEGAKVGQCQSGGAEDQIVYNTNGKKVVAQANHVFEQEDQGSQVTMSYESSSVTHGY
uniref:Disease resistance R13L4/SHOC-2-like LRR domain-containing protein n=1 Tax=Oryza glaberrima TaxID=4538 RepID=I1R255_ORYGL